LYTTHKKMMLQLSVTKEMRFKCSSKLSERNVQLSQTVSYFRSRTSE